MTRKRAAKWNHATEEETKCTYELIKNICKNGASVHKVVLRRRNKERRDKQIEWQYEKWGYSISFTDFGNNSLYIKSKSEDDD